ncbi:MAG: penicillin-binding protein [Candidatus Tokpelaia sp.]|nr:MAG: penicillin-binding protein [Candidatus Tokpelaia sp.]KAA6206079.1 MAG: penicillin-binding protein [Candidatus Tokpelaia sp.]
MAPMHAKRHINDTPPEKRRSRLGHIFYWSAVSGLWGLIILSFYIAYVLLTMPQFSTWKIPVRPPNIRIVDRNGALIANRGLTGGEAIALADMSPWLPKAVIAIEDRRFYRHSGLDPMGIGRALSRNFIGSARQGGSTLTQQLAKNLFLSSDRTFDRKSREAILALWLEYKFSKRQILEMYLNRVYLGSGAYGAEAAARRYFNKSARHLTLMEAATLAGLLKAPSRLSPARDAEAAYARAKLVLAAMREEDMIDEAHYKAALKEPVPQAASYWSGSENFVADYVVNQIPFLIGRVDEDIIVETGLDMRLQKAAEKLLRREIRQNGKSRNISQGALVSIDTKGVICALIGGVDYAASQYNRAVDAKRQPGSAFKPFVYLAALEQGKTPNSTRNDAPVTIGNWTPRNAGGKYMGDVTLTTALSHSLNSVAAQLAMEVGTANIINTAHRLGIRSGIDNHVSIALGTAEVSLLELTGAYLPFATGGTKPQIHLIRHIADTKGRTLYNIGKIEAPRLVSPQIVGMMNAMLQQTILNGTAAQARLGRPAAGKTGTSQNFRDAWFIGYTADYVTGVWFGNDNGESMRRVSGGSLPVALWKNYMLEAEKSKPAINLPGSYRLENAVPGGSDLPPDTNELPAYDSSKIIADNAPRPPVALSSADGKPVQTDKKRSIFDILRGR